MGMAPFRKDRIGGLVGGSCGLVERGMSLGLGFGISKTNARPRLRYPQECNNGTYILGVTNSHLIGL